MKIRIVSALMAVSVPACMTNCATTKTVRVLEDGTRVESSTYGLTDRAATAAEIAGRYYFRVPSEAKPAPSGK